MISLATLWSSIEKDRKILDKTIEGLVDKSVDLNHRVSQYILSSGGKRIRPVILLLLARSIGSLTEKHYQFAAAIEFIHTASLLHDDVVDQSSTRRGKPTSNHLFGNSAAVLVGDFLYTRGFQIIAENSKAAQLISHATNQLTLGEVMQLENIKNIDLTEQTYFKIIELKTAVLFSAACQIPCLINHDEYYQSDFANYGKYLGIAFQIADDVLDYLGNSNETGKQVGNDLVEKKLTLPIIYALNQIKGDQHEHLKQIVIQGDIDQIEVVLDILNQTKAIDYAISLSEQYADKAKQAIANLTDSKYKKALIQLPDFAIKRKS